MGDFIGAMGIMSVPLIISSIVAVVVILSLFLTLKKSKVMPENITKKAQQLATSSNKVKSSDIQNIRESSLIGRVFAEAFENAGQPRHVLKENVEEAGRHVVHTMDKYMTALGTVAAIAPLLGLLGTVVGMIEVFSVITAQGVGSPTELAGGISKALLTTAFGIGIAVPALIFHRYYRSKIDDYAIEMEKSAIKIVEMVSAPARRTTDVKTSALSSNETAAAVMKKRQAVAKKQAAALSEGQVA